MDESLLPALENSHALMYEHNNSHSPLMAGSAVLHETAHKLGRKRALEHNHSHNFLAREETAPLTHSLGTKGRVWLKASKFSGLHRKT